MAYNHHCPKFLRLWKKPLRRFLGEMQKKVTS
jgi:hypothetical protein